MSDAERTSEEFFERKYRQAGDPWDFATSPYELERYEAMLAAIRGRRFAHAFEPGCSIGVLTERLASFCGVVDAVDISATAIAQARSRTQHLSNVRTTCGALPQLIPSGTFDLIVFSEIGYYFTEEALMSVAERLAARLCKSGLFLAVHWLGESSDHLLSGDRVHEVLAKIPHFSLDHTERHTGFRLDVWERR